MDEWVFVCFFSCFSVVLLSGFGIHLYLLRRKDGTSQLRTIGLELLRRHVAIYTNRRNVIPTGLLRGLIFGAETARNFQVEDQIFFGCRSLEGLLFEQSYGEYIFRFFICVEKVIFINENIALGLNSRIFVIINPKT